MIIWLASYPKSGNTWLRSLLSSYYFSSNGEFNFELLKKIDQFPSVNYFKNDKNLYLKPEDTAEKWLDKQAEINRQKKLRIFKTHNAICKINGYRFTDSKNTLGGIYIVRDPRNVITSLANHYQITTVEAHNFMKDSKKAIIEKKGNRYLGFTALFSWDLHIDSWINYKNFPILVIRYEDLQSETFKTLKKVINFINHISKSKENFNLSKAKESIKSCEFEKLKKMEEKNGFQEAVFKKNKSERIKFFNLGKENNYKNLLDINLITQMNETYKQKLLKFNYEL
tara:strand:- start:78 stop:926 length:849 start_codon:yes stop_codon:yes gene_type:complete